MLQVHNDGLIQIKSIYTIGFSASRIQAAPRWLKKHLILCQVGRMLKEKYVCGGAKAILSPYLRFDANEPVPIPGIISLPLPSVISPPVFEVFDIEFSL
jgi:hypothetical protein